MSTQQPAETPREYKDSFGIPRSLNWLVKNEPEWAANQIRHRDQLERKLTAARDEITALRQALSQIATNLGSGAAVSENASLQFIQQLPNEVKLVCDGQRAEITGLSQAAIKIFEWTDHVKDCACLKQVGRKCDCGLRNAIAAWESLKK